MAISNSIRTPVFVPRFRRGQLLIFRLMPRGDRRERLETTRSSRISRSTLSWKAGRALGGERREPRHFSADHPNRMYEREAIRIHLPLEGRLMHEATDGEMGHHQAVELLAD